MHAIHHTEAIIVRSEPSGEANKRIWLFTKEFGLLIVTVQGVRKPEAKLQSQLSDYSLITADLIKGKNVWRLISANVVDGVLRAKERSSLARAYVRTLALLERFLIGEGQHPELFDHLLASAAVVKKGHADTRAFDALSLWRVLALLGYIAVADDEQILFGAPLAEALALVDEVTIKKLIRNATDAIHYSHL